MVERDTETDSVLREGATPDEVHKFLLMVASRVRGAGLGKQADQLDEIAARIWPPKLEGVVASLAHPSFWATREHALWLADRITAASKIIRRMRDDAEITGSADAIVDADAWLQSVGIAAKTATPPTPVDSGDDP